jgi:transcriptional regulator with XRE-family HTH domain
MNGTIAAGPLAFRLPTIMHAEGRWNGARAAEIREAAGIIARHAAVAIGVGQSSLHRWEQTEDETAGEPRASAVAALAELYGVSADEFFKPVGSPIKFRRRPKPPADPDN